MFFSSPFRTISGRKVFWKLKLFAFIAEDMNRVHKEDQTLKVVIKQEQRSPSGSSPTPSLDSPSSSSQVHSNDCYDYTPPSAMGAMGNRKSRNYQISKKDEFICPECGKKYKHPYALSKHSWEHTNHWKTTSEWNYSKHEQVQILEAASVLMRLPSAWV